MESKNFLFISSSTLYKSIIKDGADKLLEQDTTVHITDNESIARRILENRAAPCNLVLIDTACQINTKLLILDIEARCDAQIVLFGEQREFLKENYSKIARSELIFATKPSNDDVESNFSAIKQGLRLAALKNEKESGSVAVSQPAQPVPTLVQNKGGYDLLLIAASTGGPVALDTVIKGLSGKVKIPTLIVQHMPKGFTKSLAQTLSRGYGAPVAEAKSGDVLESGKVYIAPGGLHMELADEKTLLITETAAVNGVRPAADVLFLSVATHLAGKKVLAVVMTGMGVDGTRGVQALKSRCVCTCIAQDKESSVVFGMPKSAIDAGLCDMVSSLDNLAPCIIQTLDRGIVG